MSSPSRQQKPKSCAECGLAIERRGLHPDCKALRARRRKAERERFALARVQSVVPVMLEDASITVPLKWLQEITADELMKPPNEAVKDRSLVRRMVKLALEIMVREGAVHFSGRRYFLPRMLGDSRNAVQ